MLDSLALLMVNPSSQVITSEPVLLYNTQLSPSWRTADFIVSFFFFFFLVHIESRVDQFLSGCNSNERRQRTHKRSVFGTVTLGSQRVHGTVTSSAGQRRTAVALLRSFHQNSTGKKTKQQLNSTICT